MWLSYIVWYTCSLLYWYVVCDSTVTMAIAMLYLIYIFDMDSVVFWSSKAYGIDIKIKKLCKQARNQKVWKQIEDGAQQLL